MNLSDHLTTHLVMQKTNQTLGFRNNESILKDFKGWLKLSNSGKHVESMRPIMKHI